MLEDMLRSFAANAPTQQMKELVTALMGRLKSTEQVWLHVWEYV